MVPIDEVLTGAAAVTLAGWQQVTSTALGLLRKTEDTYHQKSAVFVWPLGTVLSLCFDHI